MNTPEVIRNMLLFQEKKQDCVKVMMNKRKKKRMKEGWALLAEKQMPGLYC